MNKPQWKRMSSGKYVDLSNLTSKDINLLDIEISLNNIIRFTGHGEVKPLTVAQHSWLCWHLCYQDHPDNFELQLAVLTHDAAEAYIGDVASPVKWALGESWYNFAKPIEATVEKFILGRELDEVEKGLVKYYDAMSLDIERRVLWDNQRGRDKWPPFFSKMNLEEKTNLFDLARDRNWIYLEQDIKSLTRSADDLSLSPSLPF